MNRNSRLGRIESAVGVRAPDTRRIERDWQEWLAALFSRNLYADLAPFHCEFWEWVWTALQAKKDGKPLPDGSAFFSIWSRGFAKSTHSEIVPLAEAALLGKGLSLYVSGTQEMANKHLASIEELLSLPEVVENYPHLAEPKRGKTGLVRAWNNSYLRLRNGYSIMAVGLDVGVRGIKVGTERPSLIILDDVDARTDSPALAQKKLDQLTHTILPTGGKNTIILAAQNLVHRNSVVNQIYEGRVRALANRRISGPHKAVEGLQTQRDGLRDVITGGRPTWPHLGLRECQEFIDNSGLDAFLSEYQHDLKAAAQGLIYPEFDERIHVIAWSQFAAVYGLRWIPDDWHMAVGLDWGSTGLAKHPCVGSFFATAPMAAELPGVQFLIGAVTFGENVIPDEVAAAVREWLRKDRISGRDRDYFKQAQIWRMSHEAKSERDVFRRKYSLPFQQCDARAVAGIAQLQSFMRVDSQLPHPFKPGVMGASGLYWVVDDDQLLAPRDDRGLARHRQEIADYRWRPTTLTDSGLTEDKPVKFNDDAMNSMAMVGQKWGAPPRRLTTEERLEQDLPPHLRADVIKGMSESWEKDNARFARQRTVAKIRTEEERAAEKYERGHQGAWWVADNGQW